MLRFNVWELALEFNEIFNNHLKIFIEKSNL